MTFIPGDKQWDVMGKAEPGQLWAGREEGLVFTQGCGTVGKGKEFQFVGSSWLDASLLFHFCSTLIKLHPELDRSRTAEFWTNPSPVGLHGHLGAFNPSLAETESGWFHSVLLES